MEALRRQEWLVRNRQNVVAEAAQVAARYGVSSLAVNGGVL
jgi:hypothetical protein